MFGAQDIESKKAALSQLGAQVGVSLATQGVVHLFNKWSGKSYSEADFFRYTTLDRIYATSLGREKPWFWKLDEEKKPLFSLQKQSWSDYSRSLRTAKAQPGNYYLQSQLMAEQIATYLAEREKRWFGRGQAGDLLELFLGEWLHFTLNELPTYDYDEASIKKIKQRLKYLAQAQKNETLFQFGSFARKRNKFEIFASIEQELLECERVAKAQALRHCAREKIRTCCDRLIELLLANIHVFYYGRARVVHDESLKLGGFLNPEHTVLTQNARTTYDHIKSTYTGELLQALLSRIGLGTFERQSMVKAKGFPSCDFELRLPQEKPWPCEKIDLPEWFTQKAASAYLQQAQALAGSVLRTAGLKNLLEEVYDLTGKLGEVWAYGDQRGKLSLEGLLSLLEKELHSLKGHFETLHKEQDKLRKAFVLEHKVNPDKDENRNFNKVDDQWDLFEETYEPLRETIEELRSKITQFSVEDVNQIDARKEGFYREFADFVKQCYPHDVEHFQSLSQPPVLTEEKAVAAFGLDQPLWKQLKVLHANSIAAFKLNPPGESFAVWREVYFKRHKGEWGYLGTLLLQFKNLLYDKSPLKILDSRAGQIRMHLLIMEETARRERPVWRLRWFEISLGWPFNQEINKNIDFLVKELAFLTEHLEKSVQEERQRREAAEASPAAGLKPKPLATAKETPRRGEQEFRYREAYATLLIFPQEKEEAKGSPGGLASECHLTR